MDKQDFVRKVMKRYKKVIPSWHPPHKIIYAVAKEMGITVEIDGHPEEEWKEYWKEWYENGELLDKITVRFSTGGKVRFIWNDERDLQLLPDRRTR